MHAVNGKKPGRIKRFFKLIYLKLFRINDTPQKIAAGFGLGVFFGVMPAMGPVIALFFAFIFRINRAAALLGSLLTNTWISIPLFAAAVKIGSLITGSRYTDIYNAWIELIKHFKFSALFELSVERVILPVALGYFIASLITGAASYAAILIALKIMKSKRV